MENDLHQHLNWFSNYVTALIESASGDIEPLEIKLDHSLRVLQNALSIARSSSSLPETSVFLAALYHDIARFEQYLQYGTFRDAASRNHGAWAVKILKRQKRLQKLPRNQAHQILTAICLHNRAVLPEKMPPESLELCEIIRDADKLDILKVMDDHLSSGEEYNPTVILGLPDTTEPGNPIIRQKVLRRKVAYYSDLKNLNDFRLLLGSWFFDMHSEGSKRLFIQNGNALNILAQLPEDDHYGSAKNFLAQELKNYAERN